MDYEKRFNQVLAKAKEAITYLSDPAPEGMYEKKV